MARIEIVLPSALPFSTALPITMSQINYANHLDNAALIAAVSEARVRWFASLGFREQDVAGLGIVVADAAVQYKSEAFYGETLRIAMAPGEFHKYGCDLLYQVTEQASGREIARGKTGILFFDYSLRKVALIPPTFLEQLKEHGFATPTP